MRYLVKARVKVGRERALLEAIQDGTLGRGSVAGDEYACDMERARLGQDHAVHWVENCFCATPLQEERPYWEQYFELLSVKDAHNRRNCRDWNGTQPWACCDCDCTKRLEDRLRQRGEPFLEALGNGACPGPTFSSNTTGNDRATEPNKMKTTLHPLREEQTQSWLPFLTFTVLNFLLASTLLAGEGPTDKSGAGAGQLVPLELKLPPPAFKGTPKDMQLSAIVEPLSDKPRPPFMIPPGLKNVAPGKKLTCSDKNATESVLEKITDGDKEPSDQSIIYLRKGTQWVQMDLGSPQALFAIVLWHAHNTPKVYHDVIVQIADDPDFMENVRTLFNNDQDNSSGRGVGTDREFFETYEGRLIDAKGAKARYLRFYSKGSTESALNEYTEIEVYGRPAP